MLHIRPFNSTESDYLFITQVWDTYFPEYAFTVDEQRAMDGARSPNRLWQRVIVEQDGEPVGHGFYGEQEELDAPGDYQVYVQVRKDKQRQGIGTFVYDHIEGALAERDPVSFSAFASPAFPEHIRFLTKRGHKKIQQEQDSKLLIEEFDFDRFEPAIARAEQQGIEIIAAPELERRIPDWKRVMWNLEFEFMKDSPLPDEARQRPFEAYSKWFDAPMFRPDAYFVAMHEGKVIGMSELWQRGGQPHKLMTGMTGVVREYRRRGIATALKTTGIRYARDHGYTAIQTINAEGNPMYDLNIALGYKPMPAWWWLRRMLKPKEGGPSD
jgi:GNAT superfamily N-acetyltransferase